MKKIVFFLLIIPFCMHAKVTMPRIFSDNMVLQRDIALKVWGWAGKGEKVSVSFNGQTVSAKADAAGKWMILLKPMKAGGPFEMKIKGTNEIVLKNILLGDVWVCSGQSNMQFVVRNSNDAVNEMAKANYPTIRHIDVPNELGDVPKEDFGGGGWQECTPESVGSFTAVGYFFAVNLNRHLDVPIGLINSSWGGTNVEAWMSAEAFKDQSAVNQKKGDIKNIADKNANMKKEAEEWMAAIEKQDSGRIGSWEKTTDFTNWKQAMMPGSIENQLVSFDGIAWIAKEFFLSEAEAKNPITLMLGDIDDNDQTYVNGQLIGKTKGYNVSRKYTVPASALKSGRNVIIIRIEDTGGGSGITAEQKNLKMITSVQNRMLSGDWYTKIGLNVKRQGAFMLSPNNYPTSLYNAMINPLTSFGIKGAIWYQGEANAGDPKAYGINFPAMITDWRNKWNEGNFTFLFVQLANFITGPTVDWPGLRESQLNTLSLPNTGMAVTIDIGNPTDIHPKNKQDVGYRLSLAARKYAYGETLEFSGPVFKSVTYENGKAILEFDHAGSGLACKNPYGCLCGFTIAGKDNNFIYAKAEIKDNKVIVWSDDVKEPAAVKYAWKDNPDDANLYNKEGLPASPFRTNE